MKPCMNVVRQLKKEKLVIVGWRYQLDKRLQKIYRKHPYPHLINCFAYALIKMIFENFQDVILLNKKEA